MSPQPVQVITAGDYMVSLRRFVLSTGVQRIMEATDASRSTVYRWINRSAPGMPSVDHRERLDEMMRAD